MPVSYHSYASKIYSIEKEYKKAGSVNLFQKRAALLVLSGFMVIKIIKPTTSVKN